MKGISIRPGRMKWPVMFCKHTVAKSESEHCFVWNGCIDWNGGSGVLFGVRHIYMQHHSFRHRFARSVCGLRVDMATEGPVTVTGCPGRGDGAVCI